MVRLGQLLSHRRSLNNLAMSKHYRQKHIEHYGPISDDEEVHHIDLNHDNNEMSNLMAVPKSLHDKITATWHPRLWWLDLGMDGEIDESRKKKPYPTREDIQEMIDKHVSE